MTTKRKCETLAAEHGIQLMVKDFKHAKMSNVDLPDGYQFSVDDDQRGLTLHFDGLTKMPEVWHEVFKDINTLIEGKADWHKVDE